MAQTGRRTCKVENSAQVYGIFSTWRHDIQHNGIQIADTQRSDNQHNNKQIATLSITPLSIIALDT
jgi:hypothetical protein